MSARDLARFGLLFSRRGMWGGRRIVPESWVEESTAAHSKVGDNLGYGYMWWRILEEPFASLGAFAARGYGGHSVTVIPGADLVIVHRVPTYWDLEPEGPKKSLGARVSNADQLAGLRMILEARVGEPAAAPRLVPAATDPPPADAVAVAGEVLDRHVGKYEFAGGSHEDFVLDVVRDGDRLVLQSPRMGRFALFARSATEYFVEDVEVVARFEIGVGGETSGMAVELFRPGQVCRGRRVAGAPAVVR